MDKNRTRTLLASLAIAFVPSLAMADPVPASHFVQPTSASKANDVCSNGGVLATSDRARLTVNPCTVGKREYRESAGYNNTSSSGGVQHLTTLPSGSTRVGVTDGLELNFTAPSATRVSGANQTRIVGQSGSALGAKYQFQNSGRFAHGVSVNALLPTGGTNVTSGRPEYQESYEAGYAINRYVMATGTAGLRQFATPIGGPNGKNPATNAFVPSVGLIGRVLPKTSLGAEVQSVSSLGAGTSGSTYGNLFLQHELTSHVAFDVNAGQQFNTTLGQKAHYIGLGADVKL